MDRDFFLKEVCDVFHLTLEEKVTALLAGVVVVVVEDEEDETVDTDIDGWAGGIVSAGESSSETRNANCLSPITDLIRQGKYWAWRAVGSTLIVN